MNPLSDARRGNLITGNNHKRRRNHTNHNNNKDEDDIITTTTRSNNTPSNTTRTIDLNEQKRIQTAQDIWYRKSNLGYYCFIEYYLHQEQLWHRTAIEDTTITNAGNTTTESTTTVAAADPTDSTTQTSQTSQAATTTITTTQSRGYSRASKRRRKKLGITPSELTVNTTPADQITSTTTTATSMTKNSHMEQKIHPLLLAYQSMLSSSSSSILRNIQQSNHSSMMTMIESFITSLSNPLPLTFRFRKIVTNQQQEQLQKGLIQHIQLHNTNQSTLSDPSTDLRIHPMFQNEHNTNTSTGLNQVEYYQCSTKVKSCTIPSQLQSESVSWNDILIQYSQNGCIARQELGSMLPVLALYYTGYFHIKPIKHQQQQSSSAFTFLDMCSSPGSKLLQALEIITSLQHQSDNNHNNNIVCIANDVLASRLQSLKDAVQRSGMSTSITKYITYTCQDATKFTLRHIVSKSKNTNNNKTNCNDTNDTNTTTKLKTITSEQMKFNIILCDVPCSGDGTCRKDKHLIPMFKPNIGNTLHCIQYKILYHAMELLHINGCICYSTCTLNPIENEAVVAAAIIQYNSRFNKKSINDDKINNKKQQQHQNSKNEQQNTNTYVELIDCPKFNNVQLQNGITNWKVAEYQHDIDTNSSVSKLNNNYNKIKNNSNDIAHSDDQYLQWYDSYEDAVRRFGDGSTATTALTTVLTPTLWPPSTNEHDALVQSLTKCRRLWPSDQDSGGFFLALIRKCQK